MVSKKTMIVLLQDTRIDERSFENITRYKNYIQRQTQTQVIVYLKAREASHAYAVTRFALRYS